MKTLIIASILFVFSLPAALAVDFLHQHKQAVICLEGDFYRFDWEDFEKEKQIHDKGRSIQVYIDDEDEETPYVIEIGLKNQKGNLVSCETSIHPDDKIYSSSSPGCNPIGKILDKSASVEKLKAECKVFK